MFLADSSTSTGSLPELEGWGSRHPQVPVDKLAYSVLEVTDLAPVGRTTVFGAIRRGELPARKIGRTTMVLADDLRQWLESLPVRTPSAESPQALAR